MPRLKASKKSLRQSYVRQARNYLLRRKVKQVIKTFLKHVQENRLDEAKKLLPETFSVIDKATKRNILHQNTAARKKSRLSLKLAKV